MVTVLRKAGKVMREAGNVILVTATPEDCACCGVACGCETEGQYEMVIEDLDTAWGGNLPLGPHTLDWDATGFWEDDVFYDPTCNATHSVYMRLTCSLDGTTYSLFVVNNNGQNQPWAGASGGFTETITIVCGDPIVFEFTRGVDANGACWSGSSSDFRITFTRV